MTKPRYQFLLASLWLLVWSVVLIATGAQIGQHGLTRTIAGDMSVSRIQVWPWPYVDEADFETQDLPHVVNHVHFEGVVWQGPPGQTTWHIVHTGGVLIRVDGQVVLDAKERVPLTANDVPVSWRGDHLDLEIDFAGGPAVWDYNNPTMRMGIYERASWGGWRLIPAYRLYPETPDPIEARRGVTFSSVSDVARAAWFVGLVALVALAIWHSKLWQRRAVWAIGGIMLLAILTRYNSLLMQEDHSPFLYYSAPGSDNYVLLARELLTGHLGFASTQYYVNPGNTYWLSWWTLLLGVHQRELILVNVFLSALSVGALTGATWKTMGHWAGFFSGLIAATFPVIVGYQTNLTVASPLISFTALTVAAGLWIAQQTTWQSNGWFGLANGFAGLLRPTSLFLGPALFLAQVTTRDVSKAWHGWKRVITISAMAALCSIMVILPQVVANLAAGESIAQSIQIGSNGPITMYIGANRESSGQIEYFRPAYLRVKHSDHNWSEALTTDLRTDPLRAFELYLHKLGLVWSNLEYTDYPNNTKIDMQAGRDNGGIPPRYPWLGMASLAFLGIAGIGFALLDTPGRRSSAAWFLGWSITLLSLAIAAYPVISRYRVPVYPLLCVGAGIAIQALIRVISKRQSIRSLLVAVGIAGTLLLIVFGFEKYLPRKDFSDNLPAVAIERNFVFGNQLQLLGFTPFETDYKPGGYFYTTFYWQLLTPTPNDLMMSIQLLDQNGERIAWTDVAVGSRSYPEIGTSLWPVGATLAESYLIEIPEDAPPVMDVYVGLYDDPDSGERLLAVASPGDTPTDTDRVRVGRLGLDTAEGILSLEDPITKVDYRLGQSLRITGFSLPSTISGSEDLKVGVQIEATEQIYDDYILFFHLLDEEGQAVTQSDSPTLNGDWTTAALIPGHPLEAIRLIDVPDKTSAGTYRLMMGMYAYPSLERLSVFNAQGNLLLDNLISVGTVEIK